MAWWSVHTGKLRMPCAPAWLVSSGLNISLGCCSASARLQRRTQPFLQQSWCLELLSLSLVSSWQPWSSRLTAADFTSSSYEAGYICGGRSLGSGEADEGGVRVREAQRRSAATGAPVPRAVQGLQAGDKFFTISLGGREDTVSVDRLKPHLGGPVVPAEPPSRGRPPRSVVAAASVQPWPLLGGGPCGGHIVIVI